MTKRKPPELKWESFVEQQIRQAQDEGKFDSLPGFGRPLPDLDEPYDEHWWLKKLARRENLSLLPPALQIRLDVEKTLQAIQALELESDVRAALEALNDRIRRANFAITSGPPSTTMPLDIDETIANWRRK